MDIDDKVRGGVYLTWSRIVRQTRQGNLAGFKSLVLNLVIIHQEIRMVFLLLR